MQLDSTGAVQRTAKVAAAALIIASSGFGAVYAYRVGAEHSIILGLLTVVFAVSLELLKPLAWAASFNAFASYSFIRGLALLLLGFMGLAYSLLAEFSLISLTRGDLVAHRASTARQSTIQGERIDAARKELGALPSTKSVAELQALIDATTCVPNNQTDKNIAGCNRLAKTRVELGRAKRKQELETIIASVAESKEAPIAIGNEDPGAINLATYLNMMFGITISADVISKFMALIPALAIEVGSSFSIILVSSLGTLNNGAAQPRASSKDSAETAQPNPAQLSNVSAQLSDTSTPAELPKSKGIERLIQLSQAAITLATAEQSQANSSAISPSSNVIPLVQKPKYRTRKQAEDEIVRQLRAHGSSEKWGAQRQMAFALGIDRSTFNRASTELAKKGIIKIEQEGNRVVMSIAS